MMLALPDPMLCPCCTCLMSTDYEVDFSEVYNKLARQGATFNPKAYLYRVPFASIV